MNRIQSILLAAAVALPAIATAAEPVANGQKADRSTTAVAPADSVAAGHIFISRAEADSINRAYATVMAFYLKPDIANRFPGDSTAVSRFIDGIRHAFDIRKEDSPYYAGVRMAIANFERFDNMVGMGFPLTPDSYVSALAEAMEGNTFGFDRETANHYLESEMQKRGYRKFIRAITSNPRCRRCIPLPQPSRPSRSSLFWIKRARAKV